MADLDQAIKLKPELTEAWYNRGTALLTVHEYGRGIADLDEAILG